jgi:hypothetical protein
MTPRDQLRTYVANLDAAVEHINDDTVIMTVSGSHRHRIAIVVSVGDRYLKVQSFVARRPDEQHETVYRWLLEHNTRLIGVAFGLDSYGDIYLSGGLPAEAVTQESLDLLVGIIVTVSDSSFNTLLELGFRSAIEREWQWRTSRGLNADNLAAFEHLRPPAAD